LAGPVDLEATISAVTIDSRQAFEGSVFVALPGERVDGTDYAASAFAKGSPLAIVGRPIPGPIALVKDPVAALGCLATDSLRRLAAVNSRLQVVGITGSVGKTTTKDLLADCLRSLADRKVVAAEGSFNNHIGLPLTVCRADELTDYLVLEMGANHRGEIAALTQIAPLDLAVVTAIGSAHIGEFGSLEAIVGAKAEIVAGLQPSGKAVLNIDDPLVAALPVRSDLATISFGFSSAARIHGSHLSADAAGRLSLTVTDQLTAVRARLETGLVGQHLAIDALAALAAAVAAGMPLGRAVDALDGATVRSPHRMSLIVLPSGATLLDDSYNASPEAMAAALRTLAAMGKSQAKKTVAVLGGMFELGERSQAEHIAIGRLTAELGIERLITVGIAAEQLLNAAKQAGLSNADAWDPPDGQGLVEYLRTLGPDLLILLKGAHGTGLYRFAETLAEGALPC
jgi:UDP-N-acetylmuramoyl-tripeptide--D-alanyl-D-alanine ligase